VIVGGVRAPFTDMLLQHLAGARERLAARREFDRIEYEPPQSYQATFTLNAAGERPIRVLAGGTRYDTCRAVIAFLRPGADGIDGFARAARE
jgi:hypothetical protein